MNKKAIVFCVVSLLVGTFLGKFVFSSDVPKAIQEQFDDHLTEVRASGFKFISPLLECETGKDSFRLMGLNPLQEEIKNHIQKEKLNGSVTDVAVYFRDLNNGPWFGVNEHSSFSPASLLKLPVLMAYYKKSESDPKLLSEKVKYENKNPLLSQMIQPTNTIEVGKEYTIDELIERMMVYSDNAALTVLEQNIDASLIDKITLDLGVETASQKTPEDFMSVKGYAGLFRILYNASYLEKDFSEKALELLSRTLFDDGIVAGVPKGIVISHKFGERELADGTMQLHDCGIVYYPKNPYLICIMTRGNNIQSLGRVISSVSSLTYHGIESRVSK